MARTLDLIRALLPSPETDFAHLIRDDEAFTPTIDAVGGILDPEVESAPVWLEPWATYRVQVEGVIEEGDRVVVLVRDRGRHHDSDIEVELLAGSVWTVRAGKVARVEFYANRQDLFEASGFTPPE
jgi:hypothetical protein